jgi:hypothetical protein
MPEIKFSTSLKGTVCMIRVLNVSAILLLLEWLYSPCGPSPLFQFPDLFTIVRTP